MLISRTTAHSASSVIQHQERIKEKVEATTAKTAAAMADIKVRVPRLYVCELNDDPDIYRRKHWRYDAI